MPCSFAAFLERLVALRQETGKEADALGRLIRTERAAH